jgi:hypothetical protein
MSFRIVIADDDTLIRTGLRMILATQPDLEVVGEAADGRSHRPVPGTAARCCAHGCSDAATGRAQCHSGSDRSGPTPSGYHGDLRLVPPVLLQQASR